MSRTLANRVTQSAPAGTLAFVEAARMLEATGTRVARLDIGEPHFSTPPHIVEAAHAAMRSGHTKYAPSQGLASLRGAIADHARARGLVVPATEIVVGSGVKPLLVHALLALVQAGDEVLVPDPGYPGYAAAARLAGAGVRRYPVGPRSGMNELDIDALKAAITPAARVLVLNSPHNPTGAVLDEPTLARVAELADRHDLWVVSDEIYAELSYDRPVPPSIAGIAEMRRRTIALDGLSKSHAMTGWRLGWAIAPPPVIAAMTRIIGDASTCTPAFVQHAGVSALTGSQDFVAEMRGCYRARRDALVSQLRAISGIDVGVPAGALYAFADVRAIMRRTGCSSSAQLATRLLDDHRLACVDGAAFGPRGDGHLRFSFALSADAMMDASARLESWAREAGYSGAASSSR
jgi:aspartate/methionine/tyrosine aminotransferase